MKAFVVKVSQVLAATLVSALVAAPASAVTLVYEGFDYAAGSDLSGLGSGSNAGGTGFAEFSSWNTSVTGGTGAFVQVQPYNQASGVYLNDGATINPFTGAYANLRRTGNYVGMNDGGAGSTSLGSV